ncbi:uracil-DNA glycosylase [Candidatus Dependentiae bacterium]|nr:uracil-DNA glycosylase [Candidatus Dependentiae bacterium]
MDNEQKKSLVTYLRFAAAQPKGFLYRAKKDNKTFQKEQSSMLNKQEQLAALYAKYVNCMSCPLSTQGRTQVVFGVGNPNAKLMFIGEGPGRDEDLKGEPFVGRAGQLLNQIIEAMGLKRKDVYISNVVKCRPPGNRTPLPNERNTCKDLLLFRELEIIKPLIICTLGSPSTQGLLGDDVQISQVRGKFHDFQGTLVMPTYHPAYLLRNPAEKRTVWEDMKKIMAKLAELEK